MTNARKVIKGETLDGFPASLFNAMVDLVGVDAGFGAGGARGAKAAGIIVKVKNVSGNDRERWDCMSLGDLRFDIGTDGEESVIFEAEDADPLKPPAILQEPIANNKLGDVLIFGYTLAKLEQADLATDQTAAPAASTHNLMPGPGDVQLLAAPDTSADCVRPVLIGMPSTHRWHAKAPSGGIPGLVSGDMQSATCKRQTCASDGSLTDTVHDVEIYNPAPADVEGDANLIYAKNSAGLYVVIVEGCAAEA